MKNQQMQGGIETDIFAIEKYVDELFSEIKVQGSKADEITNAVKTPLTKDPLAVLKQLQNSEIGNCGHF